MTGRWFGLGSASPGVLVALAGTIAPHAAAADEPAEVEVHGPLIEAPPREPSVAGSVIREERLRAPGLDAGDVLRTQPGVSVLETGSGAPSTASIRGATSSQTPVYLAGVRLNDDVGGTADLSLVPLWLLKQIEVYRSNAPLAGDQLGIGGAIFFEPRRPRGPEVGAGVMDGSFGAHADWLHIAIGNEGASALVGVRFEAARNDYTFVDDAGTLFEPSNFRTVPRTNADNRTTDVWALATTRVGRGRLDVVVNDTQRDAGLPGLTLFPSKRARATFGRKLAGVTTTVPCERGTCEVTATTTLLVSGAAYDDPLREIALTTTHLDVSAVRVEEALAARWTLSDRVSISPSLRASAEHMTTHAVAVVDAHATRVASRAALQAQYAPSGLLTFRALGSVECDGTATAGHSPWFLAGDATATPGASVCSQVAPAARVGAELGGPPLTLLATLGRYERVPTLTELYGISGAVRGNEALVPETGVSVEAGVRASARVPGPLARASADVFGFVREADDLVAYQRSSLGYVRPYNVGSARVAGLEALAAYSIAEHALFELSATLLDPRNTSAGRPVNDVLPYQPRLTFSPRIEVQARLPVHPLDGGKLTVAYFYESRRFADFAGLVVIPDQGSLDIEAEVTAWRGLLAVRGRIANLLNQTRFDLVGYPLPGRAAYVAMEARW